MSAYQRALKLLARRSHFRRELEAKLAQRGFEEGEVAAALDRLATEGYVDDRATAREFAASRLARGPVGRVKLQADLARKGTDPDLAQEVAAELVSDDDLDDARRAAERWRARSRPGADPRAALGRHLERKGFSARAIVRVLAEQDLPPGRAE